MLRQVCETASELPIEHQEVLLFAARALQEEKETLNAVWPDACSFQAGVFFVHTAALEVDE